MCCGSISCCVGICYRECSWLGMRRIRRIPSQLHSLQQIPAQHDMLPQHIVYKNEINREYVINLARKDETPWWWSEKFETYRNGLRVLKCFKWKLYKCFCWLIVEVILRNTRCNDSMWCWFELLDNPKISLSISITYISQHSFRLTHWVCLLK